MKNGWNGYGLVAFIGDIRILSRRSSINDLTLVNNVTLDHMAENYLRPFQELLMLMTLLTGQNNPGTWYHRRNILSLDLHGIEVSVLR